MDKPFISRGFVGKRRDQGRPTVSPRASTSPRTSRCSPPDPRRGRRLSAGAFPLKAWWRSLRAGAGKSFRSCRRRPSWSTSTASPSGAKLDTSWSGVRVRDTVPARPRVQPAATHVLVHGYGGYTTNLAIPDDSCGRKSLRDRSRGQPLTREHGWPGCDSWSPTSTSGRAPSGAGLRRPADGPAGLLGRRTATTTVATPGEKSATAEAPPPTSPSMPALEWQIAALQRACG